MTIDVDIKEALDGISALTMLTTTRVYPDVAGQNTPLPLVIYRFQIFEPLMTMLGPTGSGRSSVIFDCWATTKTQSDAVAREVVEAIENSAVLFGKAWREPVTGEDYEPAADQYVTPVQYSFWHEIT